MSYILEALRRAQAERERGQVPGLEAQSLGREPAPDRPPQGGRWAAVALLGVLLLAGAAGWLLIGRSPQPAAPPQARIVAPPPAEVAPPSVPAPPIVVVSAPPASAAVASLPTPVPAAAPGPLPGRSPGPGAGALVISTPPAQRSVPLAQLNAEQRSQWPALALGGSIWSESAASRFVIVNGQVLREGDSAAPGLVLERIGAKAIWLRWRELLVEWPL